MKGFDREWDAYHGLDYSQYSSMPADGRRRVQVLVVSSMPGRALSSETHTPPRRSRAVILHPHRTQLTSRLGDDHVRESAEPVGALRKRDQIALAPRIPSVYVVLDERAVAQQHLEPVPLAPARHLRSESSPRSSRAARAATAAFRPAHTPVAIRLSSMFASADSGNLIIAGCCQERAHLASAGLHRCGGCGTDL